jgi:hypothetical protein
MDRLTVFSYSIYVMFEEKMMTISLKLSEFIVNLYTVRKDKRDAGPQHKGDGKFRHPYR